MTKRGPGKHPLKHPGLVGSNQRINARHRQQDGVVKTYFVQGAITGLIKIGFTTMSARSRFQKMRTDSPDVLTLLKWVRMDLEKAVHSEFEGSRSHGEWFHPTPELVSFIHGLRGEEDCTNFISPSESTEECPQPHEHWSETTFSENVDEKIEV